MMRKIKTLYNRTLLLRAMACGLILTVLLNLTGFSAQCAALEQKSADDLADMVDYYTVWVHQIKTPIAAMRLMLQNESEATRRRLTNELLRIEQYVDMVLAYLRLGAESTDYVFRSCTLDAVLCDAIRKFSGEFIDRKLQLDYTPIEKSVITDEKWLSFVLEQLLSNALKYTQKGGVRIYMGAPDTLCIADSGIGIDSADLPRVFEKGYTGCNGRKDKHASGLGLYLCRRICKNLGIDMAITLVLNEERRCRFPSGSSILQKCKNFDEKCKPKRLAALFVFVILVATSKREKETT